MISDQHRYAMRPTRWALFWRTFFPYQILRFILINLRMLVMIWKSHHGSRGRHEPTLTGPTRTPARAT